MNGRIHGKQVEDSSIKLGKFNLTGSQGDFILATGSHLGASELPTNPFQYTNKEYVDSVAAGLDPKESAMYIHTDLPFSSLATSATYNPIGGTDSGVNHTITFTGTLLIDSATVSINDRVVVNSSDNQSYNGIYVLTNLNTLTRSSDFNGQPTNEVSGGEFVFIKEGNLLKDTGWVVSSPNIPVTDWGNTPIIFTQFSSVGVINAGDGLIKVGNTLSINLANNSGLTFSSGDIAISPEFSGDGLSFNNGVLNIGTSSTIQVNSNNIEVRLNSLTASRFDIINPGSASQDWRLAYNSDGRFVWLNPADSDISAVIAGSGLTGGGSSGNVTLNILSQNDGIFINPDSIELKLSSISDNPLVIFAGPTGGLYLDYSQLAQNLVGDGLTQSNGVISTDASYILTTVGLSASLTPTGSTIQAALTALDNQTMFSTSFTGITASGSAPVAVNPSSPFLSASDGDVSVYINGLYVRPNGALFFSPDGINNITTNIKVGDRLWVIASSLLYDIDANDHFFVEYYTLHN